MYVQPLLKWLGGKTQIIDDVMGAFPRDIGGCYIEPFVGGGSVLLALLTLVEDGSMSVSGKIVACDVNTRLVSFYKNIQTNVDEVLQCFGEIASAYNACGDDMDKKEAYYYEQRTVFNNMWIHGLGLGDGGWGSALSAAMFLFLNKTCFRGMYREGPHGFNVPFGHYKTPLVVREEHVRRVSRLLRHVEFRCCSFEDVLKGVEVEDFVYLDPPYAPESKTSFVGYQKEGFDMNKHRLLFAVCENMRSKKVKHVMSNADVALVAEHMPGEWYHKRVLSCRRAINSKKPDARTNEVLLSFMGKSYPCAEL